MYFIAIFLALLHISAGLVIDADINVGGRRRPVFPRCYPIEGPIFAKYPPVASFIDVFIKNILSLKLSLSVFDLSQSTAQTCSNFIYKYISNRFDRQGYKDAESLAYYSSGGILYLNDLSVEIILQVLSSAAANCLLVGGLLTPDNANTLALKFAAIIERNAKAKLTLDVTAKLKILLDAYFELFNAELAVIATFYLGNEFYSYAVQNSLISIVL